MNRLVTTGKAAEAVGVSLTTLQRWAHAGLVTPAGRTARGHFRWDVDDLKRQLPQQHPGQAPPVSGDGLAEQVRRIREDVDNLKADMAELQARRGDSRPARKQRPQDERSG